MGEFMEEMEKPTKIQEEPTHIVEVDKTEPQNEEPLEKPKVTKKRKIVFSGIGAALIAGGIFLGIFLANLLTFNEMDYSGYDAAKMEDDYSAVIKKFQNSPTTDLNTLKNTYKADELLAIAREKLETNESFEIYGIGGVDAMGVKQEIHSALMKIGNQYCQESLSKGMVSVSKRIYQSGDTGIAYKGKLNDNGKSSVFDTTTPFNTYKSKAEVESDWGKSLDRANIYILSSKTILDSSVEIKDNQLQVSVTLDPVKSILRYIKQMVTVSDLAKPPVFTSVKQVYTINADMHFVLKRIDEVYDVASFGVTAHDTKGWIEESYSYNCTYIPKINENCDYPQ